MAPSFAFKLAGMAMWHNGNMGESAMVDASSAGLLLGWGVFTTVGIENGRALWLEHHLRRIRRDAAKCDIAVAFSDDELRDGVETVVRANGVQQGLARITATRQDDGRWNQSVASDVTILALEAAAPKTWGLGVGFAVAPSLGELAGVKTTSYLPYFWSWREAVKRGWDEVLLVNERNFVVEAARSSVFWVKEGVLRTAPLSVGALEGVGRELVFEWALAKRVKARPEEISASELTRCDEVFLVSGATGPRAVSTLFHSESEVQLTPEQPVFEALRAWWDSQ